LGSGVALLEEKNNMPKKERFDQESEQTVEDKGEETLRELKNWFLGFTPHIMK